MVTGWYRACITRMLCSIRRSARLLLFPLNWLEMAGGFEGKDDQLKRQMGSLRVDSGKIRRELNGAPPFTLQQGLQNGRVVSNAHL